MKMLKVGRSISLNNEARARLKVFEEKEEMAFALASSMVPKLEKYELQKQEIEEKLLHTETQLKDLGSQHENTSNKLKLCEELLLKSKDELCLELEELRRIKQKQFQWVHLGIFRGLYMLFRKKKWRAEHEAASIQLENAEKALHDKSDVSAESLLKIKDDIFVAREELEWIEQKPWHWVHFSIFKGLYILFHKKRLRTEHETATEEIKGFEKTFKEKSDEAATLNKEKNRLESEKDHIQNTTLPLLKSEKEGLREVPEIIKGISQLAYPLMSFVIRPRKIKKKGPNTKIIPQKNILLSIFGNSNSRKLDIPCVDLVDDPNFSSDMENTTNVIHSFNSDAPVLLPDEEEKNEFGSMEQLIGIESRLSNTITFLNKLSESNSPKSIDLPIIERNSAIGKYIQFHIPDSPEVDLDLDEITKNKVSSFEEKLNEINKLIVRNSNEGEDIDSLFRDVEENLKRKYVASKDNRIKAQKLSGDIMKLSHLNHLLVRYHFYCPLCNSSPAFLNDRFDIDFDKIGDVTAYPTALLTDHLNNYHSYMLEKVPHKEANKKEIADSWKRAFVRLQDIENEYQREEYELEDCNTDGHGDSMAKLEMKQRSLNAKKNMYMKIVDSLIKEPLKEWIDPFKTNDEDADKTKISNNISLFKLNTRLLYDPSKVDLSNYMDKYTTSEPWTCSHCKEVYPMNEALLGAVDKIKHDIQVPLINTLWNNESIWSKTIDHISGASKEIRDRRIEEAKALQSPIDQFLADSRQLRAQLQNHFAQSKASNERLLNLATDLRKLDLLTDEALIELDAASKSGVETMERVDAELQNLNNKEKDFQKVPTYLFMERKPPVSGLEEMSKALLDTEVFSFNLSNNGGCDEQ